MLPKSGTLCPGINGTLCSGISGILCTGISNLKLFGLINIFKQLYNNTAYAPGNHLAIDGVPGSNYPLLNVDALNQLTNLPVFAAALYVSFPIGTFLGGYFGVYAYNQGVSYLFTFVPAASALDVSPFNTAALNASYVNGTNANFRSSSENFIAQETVVNNPSISNNTHIRFTARNSHWLYNEMEELPNNLNCSNECANLPYIEGQDLLCSGSGNYTIPGLQRGATATWSASPSGIVNISPLGDGSQATISKLQNGNTTISATINSFCGSSITVLLPIAVGPPVITKIDYHTSGGCYGAYQTWLLSATANTTVNSWLWKVDNPVNNNWNIYSPYSSQTYVDVIGGGGISVYATNACGTGKNGVTIWSTCTNSSPIIAFPNPAGNSVTISTDQSSVLSKADKEKTMIYNIRVIDQAGILKKQFSYSAGVRSTKIELGGLISGVYTVQVFDGTSWNSVQVFKE